MFRGEEARYNALFFRAENGLIQLYKHGEENSNYFLAVQMEPDNEKYKESLRKLDLVMGNAHADPNSMGRGQQGPYDQGYDQSYRQQYTEDNSQAQQAGNVCANCVCAYCMTELCCAMMRGCH